VELSFLAVKTFVLRLLAAPAPLVPLVPFPPAPPAGQVKFPAGAGAGAEAAAAAGGFGTPDAFASAFGAAAGGFGAAAGGFGAALAKELLMMNIFVVIYTFNYFG